MTQSADHPNCPLGGGSHDLYWQATVRDCSASLQADPVGRQGAGPTRTIDAHEAASSERRRAWKRVSALIVIAFGLAFPASTAAVTLPFSPSWQGSDGGYSTALSHGRNAWAFADTIDGVRGGQLHFVHNSLVIFEPKQTRVISNVLPNLSDRSYFWPVSMVQHDRQLWVLALRIKQTGTGLLSFRRVETWLARIDTSTWRLVRRAPVPGTNSRVTWGIGLFHTGCTTYIYGVTGNELHVATVPLGRLDRPWRFRRRILPEGFSNGVSLVRTSRGLRLVGQQSPLDPHVYAWRAASPAGPFTGKHIVYDTGTFSGAYTYNALAHAEAATRDSMLLSFDVNRFGPLSCADTTLYRPRLARVPLGRF
jgi:hypothetical protein